MLMETSVDICIVTLPNAASDFEEDDVDVSEAMTGDDMHYGNIFEYLSLWSEIQFLKIQKSKKIQEIQKPN